MKIVLRNLFSVSRDSRETEPLLYRKQHIKLSENMHTIFTLQHYIIRFEILFKEFDISVLKKAEHEATQTSLNDYQP